MHPGVSPLSHPRQNQAGHLEQNNHDQYQNGPDHLSPFVTTAPQPTLGSRQSYGRSGRKSNKVGRPGRRDGLVWVEGTDGGLWSRGELQVEPEGGSIPGRPRSCSR